MCHSQLRVWYIIYGFLMTVDFSKEDKCDIFIYCAIWRQSPAFWTCFSPDARQSAHGPKQRRPNPSGFKCYLSWNCPVFFKILPEHFIWFGVLLQRWIQQVKAASCEKCSFVLNLPPTNSVEWPFVLLWSTKEKQENRQHSSGKPGTAVFSLFLFLFYL